MLCYLALGSNLCAPERQLHLAIKYLRQMPGVTILKVADFYKNAAIGRKNQPLYYNTVVAIQTTLTPEALLNGCQLIEKKQKRRRILKWGARTLDVDIIFYGNLARYKKSLIIPHPRWFERDFVKIPLAQIAPSFKPLSINANRHPASANCFSEILRTLY